MGFLVGVSFLVGGVLGLLWWCISSFLVPGWGGGLGAAYLGEVLHVFFFVWYDMGVRRFVYY